MRICGPRSLRALALLPVFIGVARAVSCTNVTITSSGDAEAVRKDCTVINENLVFGPDLAEDVNLDGVETVLGDIIHRGCDESRNECATPAPFSISSSTLTTVNGSLDLWQFHGLQKLEFPNLALVQKSVFLGTLDDLELLDLTKLARVGDFIIEAANLTTLRHEKLDGFTGGEAEAKVLFVSAAIDSVDSFFSTPIQDNGNGEAVEIFMYNWDIPNVRHMTIGWANISSLYITGNDLGITLGAANTTTMEVKYLHLLGNITTFERGQTLEDITVGDFMFERSDLTTELGLFFDQVSNVTVTSNWALQNLSLSSQALHWKDLDLRISYCFNLTLASQFQASEDGSREQTWYWPQEDMKTISIDGAALSNDFFESFLANSNSTNATKVLEEFYLRPNGNLNFNCTPFDVLTARGIFPKEYSCSSIRHNSASVPAAHIFGVIGAALLTAAVSWI